jgi:hypothetical protein
MGRCGRSGAVDERDDFFAGLKKPKSERVNDRKRRQAYRTHSHDRRARHR